MRAFLLLAPVLVFALNAYATLSLNRGTLYDVRRKWPKLFLIWFLPLLGAGLGAIRL